MIAPPVTFSEQDLLLIKAVIGADPTQAVWNDDRTAELRAKIKNYYVNLQRFICCYCNREYMVEHGRAWDIEHIVPISSHPQFMFEPLNLAASCIECNSSKKDTKTLTRGAKKKYPTAPSAYKIVHPHFDDYDTHIEVAKYMYRALSPKGSATIYHCNLFRFWERAQPQRNSIRDRRFEQDVESLLFAKSTAEGQVIMASIMQKLAQIQ